MTPSLNLLHAQRLSLDVLVPQGVSALLPNLQTLFLHDCALTPAAKTTQLDAGCSRLRHLVVRGLSAQTPTRPAAARAQPPPSLPVLATAQLRQLAKLPSLDNVELKDDTCPTLFLVALGTQLTRLLLFTTYRQCEPDSQTPMPAWRASLQHAARCTRLRELLIPCATAEELGLVAPALQQLRTLKLLAPDMEAEVDGDAMMEVLLGLPRLTSLHWGGLASDTMRRWYTDRPCRWEELQLDSCTAQQLARLPLHSLKRPVQWCSLVLDPGTTPRDVRAAVANVTRRCPAGFRWGLEEDLPRVWLPGGEEGTEVDSPDVLRLLQPLFAPLASLELCGVDWHAEWVRALGEVLPRTCTRLVLSVGLIFEQELSLVARSMPWVRRLELHESVVSPEDVVAFVRLARRLKQEGGRGAGAVLLQLEEVVVEQPECTEDEDEGAHRRTWEKAVREVRGVRGGVALRVVW